MNYNIHSLDDVYKFSVPLYDYLKENGNEELAAELGELIDDCFAKESDSITAHRKAYQTISEKADNLPADYKKALEKSLELLK